MIETSLKELFSKNSDIMEILAIIHQLNLKDCWLCAGTLRNYVWDYLSKQKTSLISDVDIIFYDPDISYEETLEIEKNLKNKYPL
ncbi:MAG: nucleotidyltransferase family protein, partial [Vagococcus fluvialis]